MLKHVPANATMIELGAFWSYFTLWFMQGHPERRAVAMEPDTYNRSVGEENAKLNALAPLFVEGFAGVRTTEPQPFVSENGGICHIPCIAVADLMTLEHFPLTPVHTLRL